MKTDLEIIRKFIFIDTWINGYSYVDIQLVICLRVVLLYHDLLTYIYLSVERNVKKKREKPVFLQY